MRVGLNIFHPVDRERAVAAVREAAAAVKDFEIQWRVNLPEGQAERWLLSRGHPIVGAKGNADRYLSVVVDITRQKQAEDLRNAEERERQKREELEAVLDPHKSGCDEADGLHRFRHPDH